MYRPRASSSRFRRSSAGAAHHVALPARRVGRDHRSRPARAPARSRPSRPSSRNWANASLASRLEPSRRTVSRSSQKPSAAPCCQVRLREPVVGRGVVRVDLEHALVLDDRLGLLLLLHVRVAARHVLGELRFLVLAAGERRSSRPSESATRRASAWTDRRRSRDVQGPRGFMGVLAPRRGDGSPARYRWGVRLQARAARARSGVSALGRAVPAPARVRDAHAPDHVVELAAADAQQLARRPSARSRCGAAPRARARARPRAATSRRPAAPAASRPRSAASARVGSARSAASMRAPSASSTARSIALRSSRTLPGQACAADARERLVGEAAHRAPDLAREALQEVVRRARAMSSGRSRSGGSVDADHVQAEEEILAEAALAHRALRDRGSSPATMRTSVRSDAGPAEPRGTPGPAARAAASPASRATCRRPRRGRACRRSPARSGRCAGDRRR